STAQMAMPMGPSLSSQPRFFGSSSPAYSGTAARAPLEPAVYPPVWAGRLWVDSDCLVGSRGPEGRGRGGGGGVGVGASGATTGCAIGGGVWAAGHDFRPPDGRLAGSGVPFGFMSRVGVAREVGRAAGLKWPENARRASTTSAQLL